MPEPSAKFPKHIIAYGFTTVDLVKIIRNLRDEKTINLVAWFAKPQIVPECTHHMYRLHNYNKRPGAASYALTEYVLREVTVFMDMYSRSNRDSFGLGIQHLDFHDYVDILHQAVDFLADLFTSNKIDVVIFNNLPHIGPDFLLYKVAKFFGVPTILLFHSHFPDKFMILSEIGGFNRYNDLPEKPLEKRIELQKRVKPHYMNREFNYKYGKKELIRSLTYELPKNLLKGNIKKLLSRSVYFKKYLDYTEYRKNLAALTILEPDLNKPFIYFPLHLQPELTTATLGGIYSDQVLAIERLAKLLPDDWMIYIKENPGQTEYKRGPGFFKRLNTIPNARFVPLNTNTFDLIEKSQFVATITGTAGWEAIQTGKKALIFGDAWYQSFPGVYKYTSQFDLNELLSYTIDIADVEKAVNSLVSKMEDGTTHCGHAYMVPDFDSENNAIKVARSIKQALEIIDTPSFNPTF